ncbi:MAG: helix-turn-helix transcriptional regulator [bacterium]|nr:helix-turn-helix transcriptional regulator [bacterium]
MKTRTTEIGKRNMVGQNIEKIRKSLGIKQKDFIAQIQASGIDMNPTSYSKLEGQLRLATDKEIYVISKLLNVDINLLFDSDIS